MSGRKRRRTGARPLILLAALGVISGSIAVAGILSPQTASAFRASAHASTGVLVIGQPADVNDLDPATATSNVDWQVFHLVYDTLVQVGPNLSIEPDIASSWHRLSPKVYAFNIRRDIRFSNGRRLTVTDVVGSLNRLINPKISSEWASQLGAVKSIVATSRSQVKITLETPNSALLAALAHSQAAILPMKELNEGTFDPSKQMLGTGPFEVASHSPNESWSFKRNPHYWQSGLPRARKLDVQIIPEDSARIAALRNGSIDLATFDTPDAVSLLRGVPHVTTVVQRTTSYDLLLVNNSPGSIFRDARLRRALSLAIDRTQLIKVALGGVGEPTAAVAPAFGICSAASMPYSKPDLKTAANLVAAAGATGRSVSIVLPPPAIDSTFSPTAQVLQQSLNAIGLKANIVQVDAGDWISRVFSGSPNFDLSINLFDGYADPAMVLKWWNPTLAGFDKAWLPPDQGLERFILRSGITPPGPERTKDLVGACRRIAEDANMIPLFTRSEIVGYRSDLVSAAIQPVEGYSVTLRNMANFALRK